GIIRQANVSGHDLPGIGNTVNTVFQPVLGDVGIDAGIIRDMRVGQREQRAQRQSGHDRDSEESGSLRYQFPHAATIARLGHFPASSRWVTLAMMALDTPCSVQE